MIDESTRWGEEKQYVWFQGPWETFVRTIDPTAVHYKSKVIHEEEMLTSRYDYADWTDTHANWLVSDQNLPKPECIISVSDNDEWLVLENHLSWDEPVPIGQDKYYYSRKHLWYQIRSYLVNDDEAENLIHWISDQHFMGRWFPERSDQYQVFCREYYWSPAYHFFNNPYYGGNNWKKVYDRSNEIANVLPTSERHIWQSGADYLKQPPYLAPCKYIYLGMNLQYSKNIGEWLNENGQVACFDPSVRQSDPSALIVKKHLLHKFLIKNNLRIFWTCLGQKIIYEASHSEERFSEWLELSGVYTLNNGSVEGKIKPLIKTS